MEIMNYLLIKILPDGPPEEALEFLVKIDPLGNLKKLKPI